MAKMTPMMRQYTQIKSQYPDAILFFRLGDFYEMFGSDAEIGARELSIALTSRDKELPMCGVPHHSADRYIATLVNKGYKVAICEQMEDPQQAKGVVHREVVQVITPGTVLEEQLLEAKANNYLVGINKVGLGYGLAYADISTGEFAATQFGGANAWEELCGELARLQPAEALIHPRVDEEIYNILGDILISPYPEEAFRFKQAARLLMDQYQCDSLAGFGCDEAPLATGAAGAVLDYLQATQKRALAHLENLRVYSTSRYMVLDAITRRNLELTATLRTGQKEGSLFSILDETVTAMGGRLLRTWIEQPSIDLETIEERQGAIGALVADAKLRRELRQRLTKVYDLARLLAKVTCQSANARDLLALKTSLQMVEPIKGLLAGCKSPLLGRLEAHLDPVPEVTDLLERALAEEPPINLREGNLIRTGYSSQVDELRDICRSGRRWITALENKEREETGIKSLKVGYNKVFGYYIEVTKANLKDVPDHYQRKQTLANAERFITPELKEKEALILGAEDKVIELEYQLFVELREKAAGQGSRIQQTAKAIAQLDVLAGLAEVAVKRNYICPQVHQGTQLEITQGRHPVVEVLLSQRGFVPNDTRLDTEEQRLIILTGPNMAGKSTYLRQVALIVLMAQMGSFVPAESASIGIVDRIFTRVGASDDLGTGQSTFMVEMTELANILNNATQRSLVIIDEVGRGTSTYDGMAISQAAVEYLHDKVLARSIVSTHYHELTYLEDSLPGVKNYHVQVVEDRGRVAFLYTVARGGTDRSYGLNVARMAGLPRSVLRRAHRLLSRLEASHGQGGQLQFHDLFFQEAADFNDEPEDNGILEELKGIRIDQITPLDALQLLNKWQKSLTQE
ncbi:MAG: DNA mismatch repair protein MutS [Limnochordia bacterium]|jgi:DNA mismatch repair protein MutS